MSKSLWSEWLLDVLESAPSLVFLALLRFNVRLESAGWVGVALAAVILIGFRIGNVRFNPILLGINIHLLVITPLIVTVYRLGVLEIGETLSRYSHKGVLVTIFLVGGVLAFFSRDGFIALQGLSLSVSRFYSAILLLASLTAIVWAFSYDGSTTVGIAFPVIGLFVLRRFLGLRSNASFER